MTKKCVKEAQEKNTIIERTLCEAYSPDWLRKTAKETGLIKRERKIDPVVMFWVLVFSFGVRLQRTLASLKRSYERESKTKLSDGSWYERFTPELVLFLKMCVMHGLEYFAQRANRVLSKKLNMIKDVLIKDSTIIRLHEKLAKKFPAARTRKVAAGVKVSMLVSAVANGPKTVAIYGERMSEIKTLRIGPWVKDRLLLIDLGFFKYHLLTRIHENGGYFISRLKSSANPLIVAVNSLCRGNSIDVRGKHLKEVLPRLKRGILDVYVEVPIRRRQYGKNHRSDTVRFRLVAVYNDEEKKYHIYLTDIPVDWLEATDIAELYGARWEIELIFKELKSRYALDVVNTTNPQIVEAYIWIAILTLLVSRLIYNLVRREAEASGKKIVRYTQLRWSTIFCENASLQLTLVLAYCGFKNSIELIMEVYQSQALDPHVNRHRFREEWWC